jgi:putative OPT family oligopeptide transporter
VPTAAKPNALLAPQATLMASVAQGVFAGGLPWGMVAIGAGIGTVIIVADEILKARGSNVRAPVLAVAVGIYLPLELAVPILAGGVIAHIAGRHAASDARSLRNGMLFAAGLITGEALIGILMALPIVLTGDANVLAVPESIRQGAGIGLLVMAAVTFALYRIAVKD